MAFKATLRPKLEYCSSIWDPRKGIEDNGSKLQFKGRNGPTSGYKLGVTALHPSASVTAMDWAGEPQIRRGHMPV